MRVALSVDALSAELTGIGRYCWELARRLPEHEAIDAVTFYVNRDRVSDPTRLLRPRPEQRKYRTLKAVLKVLRRSRRNPDTDVVHGPNFRLPEWAERGIVTVHDLSVLKFPEMHPAERVSLFEREFQRTLNRAEQIITDCETVRREVIELTGFPGDQVTAVPLGIGPEFRPLTGVERAATLRQLRLPLTGYGLTVSSLEPRKRIDRLLVAWSELPRRLRDSYPLVIAGARGWHNEDLHELIKEGEAEGWAISLGYVPEVDLPAVYSGASVFVYPSVYEGFGLPPLEAMASGVPTIVAAASCLPEVTKGGAMLAEPEDIDSFATAIANALDNAGWRAEAASRGIHIASGYSWQSCVDQTIEVYGKVFEKFRHAR